MPCVPPPLWLAGPAASLRRLLQAREAADSRTAAGQPLPSLGDKQDMPDLPYPTDNLPVWMSPGFVIPLPPDAVVAAARGPRPLLMCLFALALLGAAAAAWAGLRAWRRSRQRQRQREQHRHDLESLLGARQQQRQHVGGRDYQLVRAAEPGSGDDQKGVDPESGWGQDGGSGGKHGSGSGNGSPAGTAAAAPTASSPAAAAPAAEVAPPRPHRPASSERRTRLAALLAAHLGTRRSRSLGKLPPEALPAALTHQMSPSEASAAAQAKQRRRRRHRERRAGAAASDGKAKRSMQGGPEQRRPPAPEELQLALQQQLSPPRASGRHHGAAAAARTARSAPPPPGTPMAASRTAAALSPLERDDGASTGQRGVGGSSSSSSGAASLRAGGSHGAVGGHAGTAGRLSRSSTELGGSSSAVESVLEWLGSGEVCRCAEGEQPDLLGLHGQPGQPCPLAGLQFATGSLQRLQELGCGPHGVTYRGRLEGGDVAIKVSGWLACTAGGSQLWWRDVPRPGSWATSCLVHASCDAITCCTVCFATC